MTKAIFAYRTGSSKTYSILDANTIIWGGTIESEQ